MCFHGCLGDVFVNQVHVLHVSQGFLIILRSSLLRGEEEPRLHRGTGEGSVEPRFVILGRGSNLFGLVLFRKLAEELLATTKPLVSIIIQKKKKKKRKQDRYRIKVQDLQDINYTILATSSLVY